MTAQHRLVSIVLDEKTIERSTASIDHERAIAIYDLLEKNVFIPLTGDGQPVGGDYAGPYALTLSLEENRLIFDIRREDAAQVATHILSLSPFRKIIRDYFMICDSYYAAVRTATPSQIEAIDMGRRGLHNDGSTLLKERLAGKVDIDFDTARALFTLISVLHWKG
jgi:uncharacterized protein (UPF0262 family)